MRHHTLPFMAIVHKLSNVCEITRPIHIPHSVLLAVVELAHVQSFLLRDVILAETVPLALAILAHVTLPCPLVHTLADSVLLVAARLALIRSVRAVMLDQKVTAARLGLRFVP